MDADNFYFTNRRVSPLLISEFDRMKSKKGKKLKVLDLGCGDGVMISDLQQLGYLKSNILLKAVDISQKNIELAKKRKLNASFEVADAQNTKLKENTYDLIYSWMVIEHVPSPRKMVVEIKRLLRKNGHSHISSVMKKPWAVYFYRNNGKFVIDPTHLHEYASMKEYEQVFTKVGLKVIKSHKEMAKYPLVDLILKVLMKLKIITPSVQMREMFTKNKLLQKMRDFSWVPIPGFYHIEVVVEK